jgi:ATP-dependent DNA helicase PIF1
VITGDFFQLPPVPDKMDGVPLPITYAFEAETWNKCIPHIKILTEVFRQKNRREYATPAIQLRLISLSRQSLLTF